MSLDKNEQEITIEVSPSKRGTKPTDEDVEQAIHRKFQTHPTDLFLSGDTVILRLINFGGKRP
jgi:hypothetical protein